MVGAACPGNVRGQKRGSGRQKARRDRLLASQTILSFGFFSASRKFFELDGFEDLRTSTPRIPELTMTGGGILGDEVHKSSKPSSLKTPARLSQTGKSVRRPMVKRRNECECKGKVRCLWFASSFQRSSTYKQAKRSAGKYFPPPPDFLPYRESKPMPAQTNWNIPAISEDEAKEAFIEYAASKCCYSKAPARDMVLQGLLALNTYRYYLETFTQSRTLSCKTIPYRGEPVDSAMYAVAPSPWDIKVQVPELFKNKIVRRKVPHTSTVKGCPICGCSGRRPCTQCHGLTRKQCWVCNGTGSQSTDQRCTSCFGTGTKMCNDCSGLGTTACKDCGGTGKLLTYTELKVEWKNNIFEYVVDERTEFPTELFKAVNGKKLFVDEQNLVHPVTSFPISAVTQASQNAIEQHQAQFGSTARIVRQRQTIELVFLTKVEYEWHRKSHSYYVYGNEQKVYVEDYPKKCTII